MPINCGIASKSYISSTSSSVGRGEERLALERGGSGSAFLSINGDDDGDDDDGTG